MQTFEALISLLVFVSAVSLLLQVEEDSHIDDSLYRIQLAEDAWRVLYLRGSFQDFRPQSREAVEGEVSALGEEAGLCIFIDGVFITNCRGGPQEHRITASMRKAAVYDGVPRNFTFSIGK
jgi:hypothetical protein